ncbi:hypothetical protein EsDP_00006741 [Epichloe bromicola]|uniref:Zn(2)-C6 fungal-type domain-containing protein n=1 Tax=Epichloe bromicola TaxID=79588 RepID=A0ABQ0CYH4_9HYPO
MFPTSLAWMADTNECGRLCDGEFPCKRCKDDGLVCTAGVRKKIEYKQLPRGYAEVLENTQFALIATVHRLYKMVRNSQSWELGEPDLNDRGLPVIHDIAQKLGCIRPNSDIDLPVHSVFPEDEAGMMALARRLEEQQSRDGSDSHKDSRDEIPRNDRASSSELDHSDFEDYRRAAFGGGSRSNCVTLSPQSFAGSNDFDFDFSPPVPDIDPSVVYASQAQSMPDYAAWPMPKTQAMAMSMQYLQHTDALQNMDLMSHGMIGNQFGNIKPDILSCPNTDVMMGMADPMIYSGYDGETMRL